MVSRRTFVKIGAATAGVAAVSPLTGIFGTDVAVAKPDNIDLPAPTTSVATTAMGATASSPMAAGAASAPMSNQQMPKMVHMTAAQRKAAAARYAASRQKVSAARINAPHLLPSPGSMPDYFGPYPNWANSSQKLMDIAVTFTSTNAVVGTGAGATAYAIVGGVTAFTVTAGGSGYTSPPAVTVYAGGGGAGATGTAVLVGGVVVAITVAYSGSGYTQVPLVLVAPPLVGTQATATATCVPGSVTAVVVTSDGDGYTTPPTVAFPSVAGTGAAGIAVLDADGSVDSVTVTAAGGGFILLPTFAGIRKFLHSLPGLNFAGKNDLGQYIPVAIPDTTTYSGSDYYEIELREFTQQLHADLSATTKFRGYVQTNTADATVKVNKYLGPLIVAQRDRPVRIKFTNKLPLTAAGGNLFIPVDKTTMGAGTGPLSSTENYTENRAAIHLHGGVTPWISDGTPHQWITPAGEATSYPKGVSQYNVPDMPDPGPGAATIYYTNQQSARLMFYHDHAYGITRLNVYAGEAAGYLLQDTIEQALVIAGTLPAGNIPLIIQDKTFVPSVAKLAQQDPTWDTVKYGGEGNLWFPHVYMPNQNPFDISGANAMGRWDYGPWFWPPFVGLVHGPVVNPYAGVAAPWEPPFNPGTPNPTMVPEGFLDTPLVNGTPYPYLQVQQKAYRFRILNACNDRMLNLQLYRAQSSAPMWSGVIPTVASTLLDAGAGEVSMVPAVPNQGQPANWPTDGRDGGVPDWRAAGPAFIQIGTEGGFLAAPAIINSVPIGYQYNRRDITVLNVSQRSLFLGPAERADVIIDFSQLPVGTKLILYNDAPAPVPAFDPRIDYYTNCPDQTSTGGAPSTQPGYGPNTRTIMQFQVIAGVATPAAFNLPALQAAFNSTTAPVNGKGNGAFAASVDPIIVPQARYNNAYFSTFPQDAYVRIQDNQFTYTPIGALAPITVNLEPKAIQELFETEYGRMNAILGVEIPNTTGINQTTIPYLYIDPVTEIIDDAITPAVPTAGDATQYWKITHNGVDTHTIHFHLFNVQLINRVGWDGAVRPPEANELGWKETVLMSPLEDAIVALRAIAPKTPFGLPDSTRTLNVTQPIGSRMGFTNVDPNGNPIVVTNEIFNFGQEYVWHCHLLGHEENDMMRPIKFVVATVRPLSPTPLDAIAGGSGTAPSVALTWHDGTPAIPANLGNPANEVGFLVQRAIGASPVAPFVTVFSALANQTTYTDTTVGSNALYRYRILAYNSAGFTQSNTVKVTTIAGTRPVAPTNLTTTLLAGPPRVRLSWTDNSTNETGFQVERATGNGAFAVLTAGVSANAITYTDTTVVLGNTYSYRVSATGGTVSAPSNTSTIIVAVPAAPGLLDATAVVNGTRANATLTWMDNSTNELGFTLQRATNASFSLNLNTSNVAANSTTVTQNVARATHYYWQIRAYNALGTSAWSNIFDLITP